MIKLDFVLLGIILLIVAVLLCIAWQTFFGWYRAKRQREAQQWFQRPVRNFEFKSNI
jgi:Tfp pilus assembly protein PilE